MLCNMIIFLTFRQFSLVFLSSKANASRPVHSPLDHFIIILIISNWRDTRGKWPLARNPDRSSWHRHTSLKLFFCRNPWLHGQQAMFTDGRSYRLKTLLIYVEKASNHTSTFTVPEGSILDNKQAWIQLLNGTPFNPIKQPRILMLNEITYT